MVVIMLFLSMNFLHDTHHFCYKKFERQYLYIVVYNKYTNYKITKLYDVYNRYYEFLKNKSLYEIVICRAYTIYIDIVIFI